MLVSCWLMGNVYGACVAYRRKLGSVPQCLLISCVNNADGLVLAHLLVHTPVNNVRVIVVIALVLLSCVKRRRKDCDIWRSVR